MPKFILILVASLCLLTGTVIAQPTSGADLVGILEHVDSQRRVIQFDGEFYSVARSVKVTADEQRTVDPFLLPSGQPVSISWHTVEGVKTITHIHVHDHLPF